MSRVEPGGDRLPRHAPPGRRRVLKVLAILAVITIDLAFAAIGVRLLIAGASDEQLFVGATIPSGVWTIIGGVIAIVAALGGVVIASEIIDRD